MDTDKLAQILIRHELASRKLDKADADKIVRLINALIEDLTAKVAARHALAAAKGKDRGPATTQRLTDMLQGFQALNDRVYTRVGKTLEDTLIERARHEASFTRDAAKAAGAASIDLGTGLPDTNFLRTLVNTTLIPVDQHSSAPLGPWVKGMADGTMRRLEATLQAGIAAGDTTADLVKRIEAGAFAKSRQSAEAIAITANSAVANRARLETFRGMRGITHVEWSAVLDTRTSTICQGLSGHIFAIDGPHPIPPAHPRCRSLLLPRKDGTSPPLHKPYREWLRDQSADVQDEVLGQQRGQGFRDGSIKDGDLYREDGRFRTLDDLKKAAKLTTFSPAPAPAPEPKRFSPVTPGLQAGSIPMVSRQTAKATFTRDVAEAGRDPRYIPRSITRGINDAMLGRATVPNDLTDEALSLVVGLKGELDKIADTFAVPRLRGIRSVASTTNAVANMGEGTLGINAAYVNGYTGKVETKAVAELADVTARVDKLAAILKAGREKYADNSGIGFLEEYGAKYREYRELADRQWKLRKKVAKTEHTATKEVVEWKLSDDPSKRPWTIEQYFDDPVDRMRSLLYHEMAHHVHDFYKNAGGHLGRREDGRLFQKTPPVIDELTRRFAKFGRSTKEYDPSSRKAHFPSRYATTQPVEWWAENFALYLMGKFDLVDPELVELIDRMVKNANN